MTAPSTMTRGMAHGEVAERSAAGYIAHSPLEDIKALLPSFSSSSKTTVPATSPSASTSSSTPAFLKDPYVVGIISAAAGVGLTIGGLRGYRRYWRRIKNSNDVTATMLDSKRWVRGVVTSVGDGDNFRLFHTPGPFFDLPFRIRSIPTTTKELKDETLHIRIAGVDAPECAHFGNPEQPHAKESLEWLRATLMGRKMKVQLLRKDQYNRIVGVPYISRLLLRDRPLPVMMLEEGMAVTYEAGGAKYGPWGLAGLKAYEAQAQQAKKGLWGLKTFEHPADYKKRMKKTEDKARAAEEGMVGADGFAKTGGGLWGSLKRIFW